MSQSTGTFWNVLDARSAWMKEFASALAGMAAVRSWCPDYRWFGWFERWERWEQSADPPLSIIRFPLQRGYARHPVDRLLPSGARMVQRMLGPGERAAAVLVCTAPFYAPVAERWPGKIVYYLTDLTKKYDGVKERQVVELDRRMCRAAHAVCPNSPSIAAYLETDAGCEARKIRVVPNATRANHVPPRPLLQPAMPPADLADLPRPIVGVIGNLAANVDWDLLGDAIAGTRDVSWALVGPYDMPMMDREAARRRAEVLRSGGRVRFLGARPYGRLRDYARSFDAALIPYANVEPTISGSATRFYEHLAASRPILASRWHRELIDKEPLLKLVSSGGEVARAVEMLRQSGFRDGFEEERWRAARRNTWVERARSVMEAAEGSGPGE